METIVSSYLSKKLPSGSRKSLSDSLETASRVQGLLSDDIVFEKTGPQSDPWLKTMESLQTAEYTNDHVKNGSTEKSTLGFFGIQHKAQKRNGEHESDGPQVILRNSGSRAQVGLTNVGNTCYFNSMLQCLTNCKPFYNYIRSDNHDKSVCRRNDNCVLCLLKVFSVNHLPVNPTQKVINGTVLRDLLVKMRTAVRRWKIHAQQSADEILSYVMDSMWEREMQYYSCKQNQTPMFNIFGTVIEQQYACSLCGKASIVKMVEPTIILGLVNGDRRSVQDRLRVEYGVAETLSEPKDKCNGCGRSRTPRPTMKRVLKDLPMILVVMLKRFYVIDGISHKINQFVQFPETLDLRPCMDPLSKNQNSLYKLTGVVEHWGKSVTDGHYVAYCKNYCNLRKTEGWFYLNDTLVRPIDLKEVLQKHAYLLFYTSQNQTIRTVKIPLKIANGSPVSPAETPQPKIRKTTVEGLKSGSPLLSISKPASQTNGVTKIVARKLDLEPPRFEEQPGINEPGCSGYSDSLSNEGKAAKRDNELPNGRNSEAAIPAASTATSPAKASASVNQTPSSTKATSAPEAASDDGSEDNDNVSSSSEPHKEGTARSKSHSLLVDSNGNGISHRKHRDKNGKKSIFTNLGSKLILLKNLPPDQIEVQKSLVPYESSDDEEDDAEEIVTNKIVPPQSVAHNGSRFSSSLTWVIDKFNDAPSVTSNSSQNSNVHGTSPGWKVSSTDSTTRASSPHSSVSSAASTTSSTTAIAAAHADSNRGTAKTHRSPREKVSTVSYCPRMPPALQKNDDLRKKEEQRSKGHLASPCPTTAAANRTSPNAESRVGNHRASSTSGKTVPDESYMKRASLSEPRSYSDKSPSTAQQRSYSADRCRSFDASSSSNGAYSNGSSVKSQNGLASQNGVSYWGASIDSTKSRSEREEYDEDLDRGRLKKVKHRHPWKGGDRRAENPFQREQDMRYKAHGGGSIMHKKSFKDSKYVSKFKNRFSKWGNNGHNHMNGNHNANQRLNGKHHWRFDSKNRYEKNQGGYDR